MAVVRYDAALSSALRTKLILLLLLDAPLEAANVF